MSITIVEVEEYLNRFKNSYLTRDLNILGEMIQDNLSCFILGSGKDEMHTNKKEVLKQFARDFSEIDEIEKLEMVLKNSGTEGNIGWLGGFMNIKILVADQKIDFDARFTMILHKIKGRIFMRQLHVSLPHAGGEEGKSLPTTKGMYDQLDGWIRDFDLNPHLSNELKHTKLRAYLEKAKKLAIEK